MLRCETEEKITSQSMAKQLFQEFPSRDEAVVDHVEPPSALWVFEDAQRKVAELEDRLQKLPKESVEREVVRREKDEARQHYETLVDPIIREVFEEDREQRRAYDAYRADFFTPEELARMENVIARTYTEKPLWHGTGRRRYTFAGQSKYDGIDHTGETLDVLTSILTTGLQPQFDPWGVQTTGQAFTLSLTEQRMLSRVVAEARLPEGESLQYEFGSSRFWWLLLMKRENLEHLMVHPSAVSMAQKSMAELNNHIQHEHAENYVDIYTQTRSTIAENYPVIFCMKRDAMQTQPLANMRVSTNFEQRAVASSGLDSIMHIEVPLKNVRETEELLRSLHISLPVIPIEEWERWMGKLAEKTDADQRKAQSGRATTL